MASTTRSDRTSNADRRADDVAAPRSADTVPYALRGLEPWVAWAVAAYTALLAMGAPNSETLWAFAIYAGLVGKWAEHVPAHNQFALFSRALALLAGAFVLHAYAGMDPDARGNLFFVWLLVGTSCYAFLLRPGWAWATLVLGLFVYLMSWMEAPPQDAWAVLLSQAGFLCIFTPLVAMRFGAVMRRTNGVVDDQFTDRATGLYNRAGLLQHGEDLAATAHRERQPVALAMFDCSSIGAIYELQGRATGRKARAHWVRRLRQLAGERAVVGRTGPSQFTVVVPGTSAARLQKHIERELGTPARVALPGTQVAVEPKLMVRDIGREQSLATLFDLVEHELQPQGVEEAVRDSEPAEEQLLTRFDLESVLSVTEYEGNGFAATDVLATRPAAG